MTKLKVAPEHWDKKKQKVKRGCVGSMEMNGYLDRLREAVTVEYYKMAKDGKLYPEAFKERIKETVSGKQSGGMMDWLDKFIHLRATGKDLTAKGDRVGESVVKRYKVLRNHLERFADASHYNLAFGTINQNFLDQFLAYCFEHKGLNRNTVGRIIATLKTFLNWTVKKGINDNLDFKRFETFTEETDQIYLSLDEIETIWALDLADNKRLEHVRDLFVIGCFTALRISDFKRLGLENIQGNMIHIITQKTNQPVIIPLHPYVKSIIEKYSGKLPKIADQRFNEHLKTIGQLAGLRDKIKVRDSRGGIRKITTKEKWEMLSSHVARRSAATNMYKAGIPTLAIRKITAHRTESAFMKYIRVTSEENAEKLANDPFFNPLSVAK